jgi:hypothetical protein
MGQRVARAMSVVVPLFAVAVVSGWKWAIGSGLGG